MNKHTTTKTSSSGNSNTTTSSVDDSMDNNNNSNNNTRSRSGSTHITVPLEQNNRLFDDHDPFTSRRFSGIISKDSLADFNLLLSLHDKQHQNQDHQQQQQTSPSSSFLNSNTSSSGGSSCSSNNNSPSLLKKRIGSGLKTVSSYNDDDESSSSEEEYDESPTQTNSILVSTSNKENSHSSKNNSNTYSHTRVRSTTSTDNPPTLATALLHSSNIKKMAAAASSSTTNTTTTTTLLSPSKKNNNGIIMKSGTTDSEEEDSELQIDKRVNAITTTTVSTSNTTIMNLNESLLLKIMSLLPIDDICITMCRVSKHFNNIIGSNQQLWKSLNAFYLKLYSDINDISIWEEDLQQPPTLSTSISSPSVYSTVKITKSSTLHGMLEKSRSSTIANNPFIMNSSVTSNNTPNSNTLEFNSISSATNSNNNSNTQNGIMSSTNIGAVNSSNIILNNVIRKFTPATSVPSTTEVIDFIDSCHLFQSRLLIKKLIQRYIVPREYQATLSDIEWQKMVERPIQLRVGKLLRKVVDQKKIQFDYSSIVLLKTFIKGYLTQQSEMSKGLHQGLQKKITQNKVFDITKMSDAILGKIFRNFEFKDLSNCTMVCQKWNKYIKTSNLWEQLYNFYRKKLLTEAFKNENQLDIWEDPNLDSIFVYYQNNCNSDKDKDTHSSNSSNNNNSIYQSPNIMTPLTISPSILAMNSNNMIQYPNASPFPSSSPFTSNPPTPISASPFVGSPQQSPLQSPVFSPTLQSTNLKLSNSNILSSSTCSTSSTISTCSSNVPTTITTVVNSTIQVPAILASLPSPRSINSNSSSSSSSSQSVFLPPLPPKPPTLSMPKSISLDSISSIPSSTSNPTTTIPNISIEEKEKEMDQPNDQIEQNNVDQQINNNNIHDILSSSPTTSTTTTTTTTTTTNTTPSTIKIITTSTPVQKHMNINQLVDKITSITMVTDISEVNACLATYRTFISTSQLVEKLLQRYHIPRPAQVRSILDWRQRIEVPIQIKVCKVLKKLIDDHFNDFSPTVVLVFKVFLAHIVDKNSPLTGHLIRSFSKKLATKNNLNPANNENGSTRKSKSQSKIGWMMSVRKPPQFSDILAIPAEEIAKQLTLIEFDIFSKIQSNEFLNQAWAKEKTFHLAPNIRAAIDRFNLVTKWVSTIILKEEKIRTRTKVMSKLLKVAKFLKTFSNYHTLMAILSGLADMPIYRLKFTQSELKPKIQKLSTELQNLMSVEGNHEAYRTELSNVDQKQSCIPYLGVYLKDLTFIQDDTNKTAATINMRQSMNLYHVLVNIQNFQKNPYTFEDFPKIRENLLNLSVLSEDNLYLLSVQREPRGCKRSDLL
ncbi:hypothetical protein CYY_004415 [Polysphondylium violaceum]|uniref:Ras guanine nucleotide exchange factor n=1 Tax=Polysphondylium violaceum TaxID=133409 RepID=A0A8J4V555_9MYCE|nr:hypothetical protein CYY_004415 [Polysphondylium violaceum]